MLSEEFFTSGTVNQLTIPAMVTFAGLWVYLDDAGRGEDNTLLIKAKVWPRRKQVSEAKVAGHLDELTTLGMVCRYGFSGLSLLHVIHWSDHQKPQHPTPSRFAPCSLHEPEGFAAFSALVTEPLRRASGEATEALHPSVVKVSTGKDGLGDAAGCGHETPHPNCLSCRALSQVRA